MKYEEQIEDYKLKAAQNNLNYQVPFQEHDLFYPIRMYDASHIKKTLSFDIFNSCDFKHCSEYRLIAPFYRYSNFYASFLRDRNGNPFSITIHLIGRIFDTLLSRYTFGHNSKIFSNKTKIIVAENYVKGCFSNQFIGYDALEDNSIYLQAIINCSEHLKGGDLIINNTRIEFPKFHCIFIPNNFNYKATFTEVTEGSLFLLKILYKINNEN